MTAAHVLALDLGSTTVRGLVLREDGRVVGRAERSVPVVFPRSGRVEHPVEPLLEACTTVLRGALAASGLEADSLAALGISSQRSTCMAWDRETGRALAPAIGWQDQRTAARVKELLALGLPLNTLASASKFEWWLRDEGAQGTAIRAAARAGRLCLGNPDAWLGWHLSSERAFVTDPGHAACTALFDARQEAWSDRALEFFSIDPAWLPTIVATNEEVGGTPHALLGARVPVAARVGDQQAATFAQGVRREGRAKLTLGTSAMLDRHTGVSPAAPRAGSYPLPLWRLVDGERAFCLEGTVVTAGAAVDWLVELGLLSGPEALDAVAAEGRSDGVEFVPALQGLGTPFHDDDARGLLGGLTRGSNRADIVRAVVDGIAHRCVDVCEALEVSPAPLAVDGGLARSGMLLQRIADLSGRELRRAAETETTAIGAALLAGLSMGVWTNADALLARLGAPRSFAPEIVEAERLAARDRWRTVLSRARGEAEPT